MPTAFEVPANELINRLAKHLKENVSEISPPPWSEYAKTGATRRDHRRTLIGGTRVALLFCERSTFTVQLEYPVYEYSMEAMLAKVTRPNIMAELEGQLSGSRCNSFRKPSW